MKRETKYYSMYDNFIYSEPEPELKTVVTGTKVARLKWFLLGVAVATIAIKFIF